MAEFRDGRVESRNAVDRLAELRNLGDFLVRQYLGPSWHFDFDHGKSRAGMCNYRKRRISLSRHLATRNSDEFNRQTLLHEIAHGLAGHGAGHGPEWLRLAREIGYTGDRTHSGQVAREYARWLGVCPQGHEVLRFRRPKNMGKLSCAQCAPRFDRRYLISWRERSAAELAADRVA